jgi:hypothetical protein
LASAFNESSVIYAVYAKTEIHVVNVCKDVVNANIENYTMKEDNSSGNDALLMWAGIEANAAIENDVINGTLPAAYDGPT